MAVSTLCATALLLTVSLPFPNAWETLRHRWERLGIVDRLFEAGMRSGEAFAMLTELTAVGPRLAGSKNADKAVMLARKMMERLELDNIHLEPVEVRHWERGEGEAAGILGGGPLAVCALGGSVGTPQGGLAARVVEVHGLDDVMALGDSVKGKIVFYNRAMDPAEINSFRAYSGAANQRVHGASAAARFGAVAVLVRSLTTLYDDNPHTGILKYDPRYPKIPAAAISLKGAAALSRVLEDKPEVRVFLRLPCRELGKVITHNVVGEITGTERPSEIVLVGGHLDSWDKGTGAHDDGAGCVQSLEALRLIEAAGLRPKRTIRAVLFMDEEMGGTGGKAYAVDGRRDTEHHMAAIESDRGGFLPLGFSVKAGTETVQAFKEWEYLLKPLGMFFIEAGYGGVDINPLSEKGTVTIGLVPDSQRYFDVHHSDNDVLSSVHPRELQLGAVAMAVMAYVLAEDGLPPIPVR